ncbi:MAG TPA: hypothetical protein VFK38_04310 [Candidatus Limnocylindrales bacterium]|nr:hypothetical protein [Candidatus Limnocylindrales bacterium]
MATTEPTRADAARDDATPLRGVMDSAQEAAERVRAAATDVAEQLPAAVATAQTAAADTARTLEAMPDRTLLLGSVFSLGMATGFFVAGAPRMLVLLAAAPAIAMAGTLAGRQASGAPGRTAPRRA